MEQEILSRLQQVEKRFKRLQLIFSVFLLLTIGSLITYGFATPKTFNIIRAKGIVIEDQNGKDRILIGAPIPFSKDRVRTDTTKVRQYWGKSFEDMENQYMEWYKKYKHSAEGIVIMNEEGFDRVLLGDKLSDPNTGQRMFEPAGILWNDKQGWELGGAGVNTTKDGKSRSIMGVDSKDGEAVHLVALEDGTNALVINGENGRLLIGTSKKNGNWFKSKEAFAGIKYFDTEGKLVWEQKMRH
ncbi:hypothetical protein [Flavobacterium sp.]|uniref:hypothetical protein n=1 Tax=Flavobacterium sp. TaxID=239 RepID=UPI00260C8411|nr:hypothetical protein [Flavobacterium sp.]